MNDNDTTEHDTPSVGARLARRLLSIFKYLVIAIMTVYLAVWGLSPFVLHSQISKYLHQHDVSLSENSHFRYNPFLSRLTLGELVLHKDTRQVMTVQNAQVELHLHRLLSDTAYIHTLNIDGLNIVIDNIDQPVIAGLSFSDDDAATQAEPETVSASPSDTLITLQAPKLELSNAHITYRDAKAETNIIIKRLTLQKLSANTEQQRLSVDITGTIGDGQVDVDADINMANGSGKVSARIALKQIGMDLIHPYLDEQIESLGGKFSLTLKPELTISNTRIDISSPINLALNQFTLQQDRQELSIAEHIVDLEQLDVSLVNQQLNSMVVVASSKGEGLAVEVAGAGTLLSWQGFSADAVQLNYSRQPADTATPAFDLNNLNTKIKHIGFEHIVASQVAADTATPPLLELEALHIDNVTYDRNTLAVDGIALTKLNSSITIERDKQVANLVAIKQDDSTQNTQQQQTQAEHASPSKTANDAAKPDLIFTLNTFDIGSNSRIEFLDKSVSPNYQRAFVLNRVRVQNIDSRGTVASPFIIDGKSDDYAKFSLTGNINPFSEKVNADIKGDLNEFSLPAVSAYIKDSLGFEIKAGQLDTNVDVRISDSAIDGDIKLFLRGIDFASNDANPNSLKDQTAVPLNVALGMLKNKDGNIKLGLPLNGSIEDPSFGVSSFIGLITKKAIMSTAQSYLVKTFVPYANVVSFAKSAGEFVLKLRFEDLPFKPAETEIGEDHSEYMQQFIALMNDKHKTQVKVCGVASPQDLGSQPTINNADQENVSAMLRLASLRAENFKKWAVNTGKIESSRVLVCSPQVDTSKDAIPRITISI